MANRPAQVTQTEISRTIKGAVDVGVVVGRVDVDHRAGKVIALPARPDPPDGFNSCDALLR